MPDMLVVLTSGIVESRIIGVVDASRLPAGRTVVDAVLYSESMPGAALVWPRVRRDALLAATDWTQAPDAPLTADQITEARTYRAALRNLPTAMPSANAVTWPTPPSWLALAA